MRKIVLLLIALTLSTAATGLDESLQGVKLTGFASYQGGQVVSGTYQYSNDISHYWYQKMFANVGFIKTVNKWLTITAAMEMNLNVSYKQGNTFPETERFITSTYIDQARGDVHILDNDMVNLDVTAGYFTYGYNEDVRNLGNILFRSYCYAPTILQSEFDFPNSRLGGLKIAASFLKGLISNDFLLTTQLQYFPTSDFSIADIVGCRPFRGISVKGGFQLDRILSVDEKATTPKKIARRVDPANPGDTVFYTFAGTKLMACINLDPKKWFFKNDDFGLFGKEDFKIYGEVDVLGTKDYYFFYEKIEERIPITFGLNWWTHPLASYTVIPGAAAYLFNNKIDAPTVITSVLGIASGFGLWKLGELINHKTDLDVLSIEFEYFPFPYRNSWYRPINNSTPFPDFEESTYNPDDWRKDDWKWSVYAKKTISNFSFIMQAARDHLQLRSLRDVDNRYQDNLIAPNDMYYQFKLQYNF